MPLYMYVFTKNMLNRSFKSTSVILLKCVFLHNNIDLYDVWTKWISFANLKKLVFLLYQYARSTECYKFTLKLLSQLQPFNMFLLNQLTRSNVCHPYGFRCEERPYHCANNFMQYKTIVTSGQSLLLQSSSFKWIVLDNAKC